MALAQVALAAPDLRDLFARNGNPPLLGNISAEYYHADRSCVSSTSLKEILRSPAHYRVYMDQGRVETAALAMGTAIHTRVLEPQEFATRYAVGPAGDRRTADWKQFAKNNVGRRLLTRAERTQLDAIASSIATHDAANALLQSGYKEVTLIWQDEDTGLWLKARPDILCLDIDTGICVDLKSTDDATPQAFVRSCIKYSYDLSAAMYQDGLRAVLERDFDYLFLAAEKSAPYARALYGAPEDMLERGRRRYKQALVQLKHCLTTGDWPGYQPDGDYELLDWPRYAA